MRVLLTGASGFIGSHVADALVTSGHDVFALTRPGSSTRRLTGLADRVRLVTADLNDAVAIRDLLEQARPEACAHLAWYAEPGEYVNSPMNVSALDATLTLLQELFRYGCRHVVGAGTCAEYSSRGGCLDETSAIGPETIYAASKHCARLLGERLASTAGATFCWARLFYLYGPAEDPRRLVPAAITTLLRGEPFLVARGDQSRDYLHVADVASAFSTLVAARAAGVFNVSSAQPIPVRQMVESLAARIGRPDLLRFGSGDRREWAPDVMYGANTRLQALGWTPRFSLSEGLAATVEWWRAQLSGPR